MTTLIFPGGLCGYVFYKKYMVKIPGLKDFTGLATKRIEEIKPLQQVKYNPISPCFGGQECETSIRQSSMPGGSIVTNLLASEI